MSSERMTLREVDDVDKSEDEATVNPPTQSQQHSDTEVVNFTPSTEVIIFTHSDQINKTKGNETCQVGRPNEAKSIKRKKIFRKKRLHHISKSRHDMHGLPKSGPSQPDKLMSWHKRKKETKMYRRTS